MVARSVKGGLEGGKERRAHVWAFESHREKEKEGTGERFAGPQRGWCACIYAFQKTSYARANPGRFRRVKQGAIEEEDM